MSKGVSSIILRKCILNKKANKMSDEKIYLQTFQEDGDWTENFVLNVQMRPPIYDSSLAEHSDRNLVAGLWNEILENLVPTWCNMTQTEKNDKVKEVQNKWKNLKTCFRRELRKQKQGQSGQAASKRRKYIYFDQLSFLIPVMEDRPTTSNIEIAAESGDDPDELLLEPQGADISSKTRVPGGTKKKQPTYEENLLTILREKKEEDVDEDKSFLLSLLPSFKKLPENKKLDLKIDFLAALKRINKTPKGSHGHKKGSTHSRRRSHTKYDESESGGSYSSEEKN